MPRRRSHRELRCLAAAALMRASMHSSWSRIPYSSSTAE
jgi:hypothetical protein